MKVTTIRRVVTTRQCPGCGWLVSQMAIELAQVDVVCGGCRAHRLSEFKPAGNKIEKTMRSRDEDTGPSN